jgi:hypothetical protein
LLDAGAVVVVTDQFASRVRRLEAILREQSQRFQLHASIRNNSSRRACAVTHNAGVATQGLGLAWMAGEWLRLARFAMVIRLSATIGSDQANRPPIGAVRMSGVASAGSIIA